MSSHIRSLEDAFAHMICILKVSLPSNTICITIMDQISSRVVACNNRGEQLLRVGDQLAKPPINAEAAAKQATSYVHYSNVAGHTDPFAQSVASRTGPCSMTCVTFMNADHTQGLGSICMLDRTQAPPTSDQLAQIHSMAQLIGYMVELDNASVTDSMTGLYNRRYLKHLYDNGSDKQFSVLFVDMDDFKNVNDRYGHDIGDQLLQEIAGRLRQSVRKSDIVIRYGGDEFLICLQHMTEEHDLNVVLDKLRLELQKPYVVDDHQFHVTASVGISFNHGGTATLKELISSADIAMYGEKQTEKRFDSDPSDPDLLA